MSFFISLQIATVLIDSSSSSTLLGIIVKLESLFQDFSQQNKLLTRVASNVTIFSNYTTIVYTYECTACIHTRIYSISVGANTKHIFAISIYLSSTLRTQANWHDHRIYPSIFIISQHCDDDDDDDEARTLLNDIIFYANPKPSLHSWIAFRRLLRSLSYVS